MVSKKVGSVTILILFTDYTGYVNLFWSLSASFSHILTGIISIPLLQLLLVLQFFATCVWMVYDITNDFCTITLHGIHLLDVHKSHILTVNVHMCIALCKTETVNEMLQYHDRNAKILLYGIDNLY